MHKLLSLWKEQKGKGTIITVDENEIIKVFEIAINSIKATYPDKKLLVLSPSSLYFKLRPYFPDIIANWSDLYKADLSKQQYFAVFVAGVNHMSKFSLDALFKLNTKFMLGTSDVVADLNQLIVDNLPVVVDMSRSYKELNYVVTMDTDTMEMYDKVVERMKEILTVFRTYDNITYSLSGFGGTSASDFRNNFARDNGWSREMDINIPMFKSIDECYNPDILYEQASLYNKLILERHKLISKSASKLDALTSVILSNKNKRFLVLAKGDDVCDDIADKLVRQKIKAESIHANTESRNMRDENGRLILIKTGVNKGQPKLFGTKSVNDAILRQFNARKLSCLVTTGTLDKSAVISGLDAIIIISPKASNYFTLKSRIQELSFDGDIIIINIVFDVDVDINVYHKKQQALNVKYEDVFFLGDLVL